MSRNGQEYVLKFSRILYSIFIEDHPQESSRKEQIDAIMESLKDIVVDVLIERDTTNM